MENLDENEVQVGNKVYSEKTQITLTAKTMWTLIAIIVAGISALFGVLKNDISSLKNDMTTTTSGINSVEAKVDQVIKELTREEIKPLKEDVNRHDGDIKVLLDRTNSRRNSITIVRPDTNSFGNSAPPPN